MARGGKELESRVTVSLKTMDGKWVPNVTLPQDEVKNIVTSAQEARRKGEPYPIIIVSLKSSKGKEKVVDVEDVFVKYEP
jgi:hypothetical protein